ncbi:hypothetical protein OOK06_31955 [Streptomyces sp. NBC_00340]|uniref:hypothetical protein n=1 Tax=Streptomyces sp. NBC_00340 TaxID=2975716 RepID=UPI00225132E5|nr:hypothetical protein [Streptomyces sp. NBC_00340]MCX5136682.1 hypothetical protein [Streptomyces sp. NBC_00340]
MITLAVPELDVAYFSELANVMAAADRRGCTVLIHATGSRRDRELSALNGFDAQFTDGVILSALTLRQRDLDHHEKHLPVVLLGDRHTPAAWTTWASTTSPPPARPPPTCWPEGADGSPSSADRCAAGRAPTDCAPSATPRP